MTNDALLSKTVTALRFPLIVGVVFIHNNLAAGISVNGVGHGMDCPQWYYFIVNLISGTFASATVPLFFFISGFFFFYNSEFNNASYEKKLKSRFRTLFIPFLLWNLIAILWQMKCYLPFFSSFCSPVDVQLSIKRIINTFFRNTGNNGIFVEAGIEDTISSLPYPINFPLWYLRDLMAMVILSPVVYWLVKYLRFRVVAIFSVIWFVSPLLFSDDNYFGQQLIVALLFYTWGGYYGIHNKNFCISFRNIKFVPYVYLVIAVFDAMTKNVDYNFVIHKIGIICGVISLVVIVSCLIESEKMRENQFLATSSFFVYACHILILSPMRKALYALMLFGDDKPYAWLAFYFFIPCITIILCLLLYMSLKKCTPSLLKVLNGGR